jgi:outer membrane protein assembly factor BamD (BamD/ComL family)
MPSSKPSIRFAPPSHEATSLGSLSLLDTYFQNFHHGRLHLEAEVLRIDALARVGQAEAARSYAKEFLRRNPKSVHAARLQSIVGP